MKNLSNKNLIYVVSAAVLVLASLLMLYFFPNDKEREGTKLVLNGRSYPVEVANTEIQRKKGLSGRDEIGSEGLLFVFQEMGEYGFWMKDMRFSIDIIWLDEQFNVVHMEESVPADSYPKIYEPKAPAKYVFEAEAGFARRNKIELGQKLEFQF